MQSTLINIRSTAYSLLFVILGELIQSTLVNIRNTDNVQTC